MQREKKFTEGPWQYQNDCDVYTHIVRPVKNLNTILVHLRQDSSGESEANAHLISAAPELLEELEKHCAACKRNLRVPCGDCKTGIAIAKAYGEGK